jgi:alkaline phosphatase D
MCALSLGPIVGSATSTTAKVWVRSTNEEQLLIEAAVSPDFSQIEANAVLTPLAENDYTATSKLQGLAPDTRYYYRVTKNGARIDTLPGDNGAPCFSTFPPEDEVPRDVTFAFGSCFNPFHSDETRKSGEKVLRYILDHRDQIGIRFMILLGDQVYTDSFLPGTFNFERAQELPQYYEVYQKYWSDLNLRKVLRGFPNFMIFDDHELWNDWGTNLTNDSQNWFTDWRAARETPRYQAATKAYFDYQQSHNPTPIPGEDFAYTFQYGRIGFFVMDARTRRKQIGTPSGHFLGDNQNRALKDWLLAPHFVKFIVSSVPMVHAHGTSDQWGGAKEERKEILDYIVSQDIKGVHFLSGDVHRSHCVRLDRSGATTLPVFFYTSSPIANQPIFNQWPLGRVEGYKKTVIFKKSECNFGTVRVRNINGRPLVHFSVYDEYGTRTQEGHFV